MFNILAIVLAFFGVSFGGQDLKENLQIQSTPETFLVEEEVVQEKPVEVTVSSNEETNFSDQINDTSNKKLYSVVRVVDGDTVVLDIDGTSTTLRLIGFDTPEIVDPRKPVQCFGKEASDYAKFLLSGEQVYLEYDKTQDKIDKYGRLLAYLYLEDGRLFNEIMIREGYAHEYTYIIPYEKQKSFMLAEDEARVKEKGLWAPGVCEDWNLAQTQMFEDIRNEALIIGEDKYSSNEYFCGANFYNCPDFSTHDEAQYVYEICGGINKDIHFLDRDKDGYACESLP